MPEQKPAKKGALPKKKTFETQVDSILGGLQVIPGGTEESDPKAAGQPQAKPVVTKLIDFIKKM